MENSSRAFLDTVGCKFVDPKLLTCAEKLQYESLCAGGSLTKPFSASRRPIRCCGCRRPVSLSRLARAPWVKSLYPPAKVTVCLLHRRRSDHGPFVEWSTIPVFVAVRPGLVDCRPLIHCKIGTSVLNSVVALSFLKGSIPALHSPNPSFPLSGLVASSCRVPPLAEDDAAKLKLGPVCVFHQFHSCISH